MAEPRLSKREFYDRLQEREARIRQLYLKRLEPPSYLDQYDREWPDPADVSQAYYRFAGDYLATVLDVVFDDEPP